ncbi:MAG: RNHCP domain-containing protein [Nitrospirae bacterium]|nr:RNHCP domain-containing protein [Nitrospirota bacterium]
MKKINEPFTCKNCGEKNPKVEKSCRNHCRKCLYSLHVDKNTPGDRESSCKSLMEPSQTAQTGKKGWIIYHKCTKCGKIIPNKVADDDNFEKIIELSQPTK